MVGAPHGPFEIVQRKVFVPCTRPETVDVGLLALAKIPPPVTSVQVPNAGDVAVLAASVVLDAGRHNDCCGPAFAAGWFGS